jgi:hypothetical protein
LPWERHVTIDERRRLKPLFAHGPPVTDMEIGDVLRFLSHSGKRVLTWSQRHSF